MKVLRRLQPGEELFISTLPGFRLHLVHVGSKFEYRVPAKHRFTRTAPRLESFYGIILVNADSELLMRPSQLRAPRDIKRRYNARIPYNVLSKVLVFTGLTNEATVKTTRQRVVGSSFSTYRGFAWDNRNSVPIPLEHPHMKPAERLFEEVLIA